jgi:hypothetical protein
MKAPKTELGRFLVNTVRAAGKQLVKELVFPLIKENLEKLKRGGV